MEGRIMKTIKRIKSGLKSLGLAALLFGATNFANATERLTNTFGNVQANTNAVAEWEPQHQYNVSYLGNGSVTGTESGWYDQGTTISNNAIADQHWNFTGWSNVPGGMEIDNPLVFSLDSAYTNAIANFVINSYNLIVNSSHGTPSPEGTNTYNHGTSIDASLAGMPVTNGLERYVPTGWTLTGGVNTNGTGTNTSFQMLGPTILDWNHGTQYFFNASSTEDGTISGNTNDWFDAGVTNQLIANPNVGRHFVAWKSGEDTLSTTATNDFIMTNGIDNILATFGTNQYTLSLNSDFGNPSGAGTYNHGQAVTGAYDSIEDIVLGRERQVAGSPVISGHELNSSSSGGRNYYSTDSITNSFSITVPFTRQYNYGVSSLGNGFVIGNGNGWYNQGTTISNNAVADPTYEFVGWLNVPSGKENQNPLVFNLNNAYTNAIANFDLKQYDHVFKDTRNENIVTNRVPHGSHFSTNFPEIIYLNNDENSGVRYKATTFTSTGTGISTNEP
jgi:hypothetical protein